MLTVPSELANLIVAFAGAIAFGTYEWLRPTGIGILSGWRFGAFAGAIVLGWWGGVTGLLIGFTGVGKLYGSGVGLLTGLLAAWQMYEPTAARGGVIEPGILDILCLTVTGAATSATLAKTLFGRTTPS